MLKTIIHKYVCAPKCTEMTFMNENYLQEMQGKRDKTNTYYNTDHYSCHTI